VLTKTAVGEGQAPRQSPLFNLKAEGGGEESPSVLIATNNVIDFVRGGGRMEKSEVEKGGNGA
jgi:hypothetical protein